MPDKNAAKPPTIEAMPMSPNIADPRPTPANPTRNNRPLSIIIAKTFLRAEPGVSPTAFKVAACSKGFDEEMKVPVVETARRPAHAAHYHRKGQSLSIRQCPPYPSREGRGETGNAVLGHPDGLGGVSGVSPWRPRGRRRGRQPGKQGSGRLVSPWGRGRDWPVGKKEERGNAALGFPGRPGRRLRLGSGWARGQPCILGSYHHPHPRMYKRNL